MARNKGSGTLVKRGKYYTARWMVDGKLYTRSTKCADKKDALAKLKEFTHPYQAASDIEKLQNLQSQINVIENSVAKTPKSKAIRVTFAVDTYRSDLSQSALSERTVDFYESIVNYFVKFLKTKDKEFAYEVTRSDAEEYMAKIKKKDSPVTYNTVLGTLTSMFKCMRAHDTNIRMNPFEHIKFLRKPPSERKEFTDEQVKRLLEEAAKVTPSLETLFTLGRFTGLRRGDCLSLRWDEVSLQDRMIRREPTKTKKYGTVAHIPIVDELYEYLATLDRKGEYVVDAAVRSIQKTPLQNLINQAIDAAGIKRNYRDANGVLHIVYGFHSFRHTLASKLHRSGTPINQIKTIMGHRSFNQSLHYAHVAETDLQMPDFSNTTIQIRIPKTVYELVMSKAKEGEKFEDVVKRAIERPFVDEEAARRREAELKAAKDAELDALIDSVFDKDGKPKSAQ